MMNLTTAQLDEVEQMAYRLIVPKLIAINIDADEDEFVNEIRTPGTKAREAFYKGYLRQEIELRDSLIKASKNGSNPAQIELIKYMNTMKHHIDFE